MKRLMVLGAVAYCMLGLSGMAWGQCAAIQDGTIQHSTGEIIATGYDQWGYNYQARIFNGKYCDAYRNADWCQPWKDVDLEMKWNDPWLSNRDCDNNGSLDRYYGYSSFRGSGAWTTNHQKGVYVDDKGKKQRWTYFVKIVAVPSDATLVGSTWMAADGITEIGPAIWGDFAILQEIYNDTGAGYNGVSYLSPHSAGLGRFSPQH